MASKRKQPVEVEVEEAGRGRSRAFWSGTLSFGLVTVPVEIYPAQRSTRGSLRMLASDGTPLARRYFRAGTDIPLDRDELMRGYEVDGKFVQVTDEELEAVMPEQSRDIDLRTFVPNDQIHPFQLDRSYFLAPAGKSTLAYRLLVDVMTRTHKAGIATFVMRGKQYMVAIVADEGLLRAETLRFSDELRSPEDAGLPKKPKVDEELVEEMRKAIKPLKKRDVALSELEDTYWRDLEKLVEAKRKKHKDVLTPAHSEVSASQGGDIVDLVAILRKSLNQGAANTNKTESKRARSPAAKRTTSSRSKAPAKRKKSASAR
jgi:DNA end-binding protein Ku